MNERPIADRMAQNLEIVSKNFQFITRRTRILMGFIICTIYYVVLIQAELWFVHKLLERISRLCATLSAIGCMFVSTYTSLYTPFVTLMCLDVCAYSWMYV